jgi:hypothetical protein
MQARLAMLIPYIVRGVYMSAWHVSPRLTMTSFSRSTDYAKFISSFRD